MFIQNTFNTRYTVTGGKFWNFVAMAKSVKRNCSLITHTERTHGKSAKHLSPQTIYRMIYEFRQNWHFFFFLSIVFHLQFIVIDVFLSQFCSLILSWDGLMFHFIRLNKRYYFSVLYVFLFHFIFMSFHPSFCLLFLSLSVSSSIFFLGFLSWSFRILDDEWSTRCTTNEKWFTLSSCVCEREREWERKNRPFSIQ